MKSIYLGIFFKSLAVLMFEVCLTRILSISLWHHFAFLIISCALLGYGAAGSFLVISRKPQKPFFPALLFAVTLLPLSYLATSLPVRPAMLSLDRTHWLILLAAFLILTIPFVFSGLTINLLFRRSPRESFKLYFFDLIGAACGCGLFFLLASRFKELEWIVICAILGAVAAFLLSENRFERVAAVAIFLTGATLLLADLTPPLTINPYKKLPLALRQKDARLIKSQWSPVVRVDLFESALTRQAPGISLNYRGPLPPQTGLAIDNDALTVLTPWNEPDPSYMEALPIYLPYELGKTNRRILILNVLGGTSVLPALSTNARIVVQTDNPIIADWHRQSGLPDAITIREGNARSILSDRGERFDKIFVSLEGSLPSGLTGIDSLESTSIMTVEGMETMFDNLDPKGWLVFHTYLLPPPRAELKLISTLIQVLENRRLQPDQHVGILQTISTLLVIASPGAWTDQQTDTFQQFCEKNGFIPILYPGVSDRIKKKAINRTAMVARPIHELFHNRSEFQSKSVFNLEPVTDNRPFFNLYIKFSRFREYMSLFNYKWEAAIEGGLLVVPLFLVVLVLSIIIIGLPVITRVQAVHFFSGKSVFFIWIGLGFMGMEIGLIEQLTIYLGDPAYSFAVVLSSLLLTAGFGSLLANRFSYSMMRRLLGLSIVVLVVSAVFCTILLDDFRALPLPGRFLVAVGVSGLVGVFVGSFFPWGIRQFSHMPTDRKQNQIALAWCYNGVASVCGSVGAMLICQFFGFRLLYSLAIACYLLAYIFAFHTKPLNGIVFSDRDAT